MHREVAGSARLHLFQGLSTLGQQLARPLVLCSGLGRVEPVLPASTFPIACMKRSGDRVLDFGSPTPS